MYVDLCACFHACYDNVSSCVLTISYGSVLHSRIPNCWWCSFPWLYSSAESINFFDVQTTLQFIFSMALSVLRHTNIEIGCLNKLEVNNLLEITPAAASVSIYFAICASNGSPTTSLRSTLSKTCLMTLYTTDQIPLCPSSILLRASSSTSSTIVVDSLATNFFTASFTPRAITSSF